MFLAKVKNNDGTLNGIHIEHLKNKLGTRQLPTAELLLDGMKSSKVSIKHTIIVFQKKQTF